MTDRDYTDVDNGGGIKSAYCIADEGTMSMVPMCAPVRGATPIPIATPMSGANCGTTPANCFQRFIADAWCDDVKIKILTCETASGTPTPGICKGSCWLNQELLQ